MKPVPVIKDKLYIPKKDVDPNVLKQNYEVLQFDDAICSKCEYFHDRPCSVCAQGCEGFITKLRTWGVKKVKGVQYVYVPVGNAFKIKRLFGIDLSKVKDVRPENKFDYPIKFTGTLRHGEKVNGFPTADQVTITKDYLKYKFGLINAQPRSGKTVMSVFCCCKIGVKTIVIAKQEEFLNNFYKTFMSMTNVPKIEKKLGHPIVKVVKDVKEMKNLQVALVTYQKFIRESGDKRIKKCINGRYSFLILDEVHGAAAVSFAKFVNKLVMKYRLGLSATPLRKDGRDCLIKEIVGPIVAKSSAIGMVPIVDITETGVCTTKYKGSGPGNWVYAMKWLYSSAERNKLIVNQVFRDINAGHKCILIPTDHKKHMNLLVEMIRKKAKKLARKGTLLNGESIDWRNFVAGFYSGCNRKDILDKADQGIHRVIVAVRSMVKEGIDIRAPSCIYIQTPMSANPQPVGSPFFYQLANRVCTPYAGKRQPVIRVFIDGLSQSLGCLRSLMTYELFPGLRRGKNGESPRYKMASATCRRVWDIIAQARKNAYKPLDRKQRYEQYAKYNNEYDKQKGTWWNSYKDLS